MIPRSASFTRAADFFLASFELPLEINNEKKNGAVNAPLAFGVLGSQINYRQRSEGGERGLNQ